MNCLRSRLSEFRLQGSGRKGRTGFQSYLQNSENVAFTRIQPSVPVLCVTTSAAITVASLFVFDRDRAMFIFAKWRVSVNINFQAF